MTKIKNWLWLFLFVLVFSCKKDDFKPDNPAQTTNDAVLQRILDLGYSKSDIVEHEDRYVVQGDIAFPKNGNTVKTKQAWQGASVSTNRTLIRVYLNNDFPTLYTQVSQALDQAIIAFNSVNSELYFVRVTTTNQANITIIRDDFVNACGQGGLPYPDGRPFDIVRLNEQYILAASATSIWQLTFLLAHELGHNIGLRHTNWASQGESSAIHIPGTPTSDANSVMNGGTCGNSWNNWSNGDRTAIETLYPKLPSNHQQLGNAFWLSTDVMTSLDGWVYAIDNQRLHKINPSDGSYTLLASTLWVGAEAMTSMDGWLYIVENNRLHRVNPNDGTYTTLGGAVWGGTYAMSSLNGWLYILQNQHLHKVNPTDGSYTVLSSNWIGVRGMTSMNGWLYIVENNALWRVSPVDGSYTVLGGVVWGGTHAITSVNGWIYIAVENRIYRVDGNGNYTQFGGSVWRPIPAMTSLPDALYLVENTRLYKIPF